MNQQLTTQPDMAPSGPVQNMRNALSFARYFGRYGKRAWLREAA